MNNKKSEVQISVNTALQASITPIGIDFEMNRLRLGENYCCIFAITDYPSECDYGWLSKLTNIPGTIVSINSEPIDNGEAVNEISTKIGISKSEYIPGGIQSDDILWDDYNKNLEEWVANGGVAVKCKNNINHKGLIGPIWQGLIIANDASSELIRNSLSEIAYEAAESSDEEWEL